jgi:lysosomal acid lipase/cholesteryl ester hydrolase
MFSGGFNLFNYGKEKNFEIYGTETPPPYDLSKISSSIAFYYGKNDGLITIEVMVLLYYYCILI